MTAEEEALARKLETRVAHLLWEHDTLKSRNAEITRALEEKERLIAELRAQVETLQSDYANLKTAKMLDISGGDMKEAKSRLSRLVREVDKCIALLNV